MSPGCITRVLRKREHPAEAWLIRSAIRLATFCLLASALFSAPQAHAQTLTTVTGVVTDPQGFIYTGARITISLSGATGTPSTTPCPGANSSPGCTIQLPPPVYTDQFTGQFTVNLWANASITCPGGCTTTYTFQVDSQNAQVRPPIGTGAQSFAVTGATISGSSQDVSVILSAVAPSLTTLTQGAIPLGPFTVNQIVKAASVNTLGNSSIFDDGIDPPQAANGISTESTGIFDTYTVDTAGVTVGLIACVNRTTNRVETCAAGATHGVLGIAETTTTAGNPVRLCWGGHCNGIEDGTIASGDYAIPSPTVAGELHDSGTVVGAACPDGTQAFTVSPGNTGAGTPVVVDFLTGDSSCFFNGSGGGSGNVIASPQNSVAFYSAPGTSTSINGIPPNASSVPEVPVSVNGGLSLSPLGVPVDDLTATPYTLACSDGGREKKFDSASAVAVTFPKAGSCSSPSQPNFVVVIAASGAGTVTITPTTSTIGKIGSSQGSSFALTQGQVGLVYTDTSTSGCGANGCWDVALMGSGGPIASATANSVNDCPDYLNTGTSNLSLGDVLCGGSIVGIAPFGVHAIGTATAYTITASDDKHLLTGAPTSVATYTLPQPTSGTAPYVSSQTTASCTNFLSTGQCSVTLSITGGNQIRVVAEILDKSNSLTTPSISWSDNLSNTYVETLTSKAFDVPSGAYNLIMEEAMVFSAANGSTTATINVSNFASFPAGSILYLRIFQYTTLTALDGTSQFTTGINTVPSGSITSNAKNDVVFFNVLGGNCGPANTETPSGLISRINSVNPANTNMGDGIIAFPGVLQTSNVTACTYGWGMSLTALNSTTTVQFLNGFSFWLFNGGTAQILLSPTSSAINTQFYSVGTSGAKIPLNPGQSALCMSDGTNWNCDVRNTGQNATTSPITVNGNVSTAQNLMSYTVRANTLNHAGNTLHLWGGGYYSTEAANASTITVAVTLGGTSMCSWTSGANLGGQSNDTWNVDMYLSATSTGTQGFKCHGKMGIAGITSATSDAVYNDTNHGTTGTVDTTADKTLQVTISFSVAGAANGNIGVQDQLAVNQVD